MEGVDIVAGILLGTLIYIILTVVFYLILNETSSLNSILAPDLLVDVWLAVGAILAVGDFVAIAGFILNVFSDL